MATALLIARLTDITSDIFNASMGGADIGRKTNGRRKEQTMSRYVKADMIGCPCGYCEGYEECQKEVDSAPSIDIVFCKECMFSKIYQNDSSGVMGRFCEAFTQVRMVSAEDFCSYGEREGE